MQERDMRALTPEEIDQIIMEVSDGYLEDMTISKVMEIITYTEKILKRSIDLLSNKVENNKEEKNYLDLANELITMNSSVHDTILPSLVEKSAQYQTLIFRIYKELYSNIEGLNYTVQNEIVDDLQYQIEPLTISLDKIKNLSKIEIFSNLTNKGILIIGKNGSGKSSFVSFLKNIYFEEMALIPAQKLLIYDDGIEGLLKKSEIDIKDIQNTNVIEELRSPYQTGNIRYISSNFSTLVTAIANKTIKEQNDYVVEIEDLKNKEKDKLFDYINDFNSLLNKINTIWSNIIPNISFSLNTETRCLEPCDVNGNLYNINSLSDGEKAVLYYIGNVLLAEKNSYIVVDEPETYLNPSIYKEMWDLLQKERDDCQFIYISHDIEFVRSRKEMSILWMKAYVHPNNWNLELLDESSYFPKDLLISICGAKKKIIFCEGNKEKLDYEIYTSLFGDDYSIIPVGSCEEVCKYTKALNSSYDFFGSLAIGIVDFDNRSEQEISELKSKKIYVTKYNEIEMLLCDDRIIEEVLSLLNSETISEKTVEFKVEFFKLVDKQKEKMAFDFVKKKIDLFLNNYRLTSSVITDVHDELLSIENKYDYISDYNNYLTNIEMTLKEKNYDEMLKFCNLKQEVTRGLSKKLTSDFEQQAIGAIKKHLTEYIKNKYFSDFNAFIN